MIRGAVETDCDSIAAIYNYYIRSSEATFEETELESSEIKRRIDKVQGSGFSWLVAIENEKVVGYAYSSKWNDRSAYRNTAEVSVYLSGAAHNKGWATKLYEELFSLLRQQNVHSVIGGITLPNQASVALHENFGMVKVAHFKEVGRKFNKWLDVGYWQVQLNA